MTFGVIVRELARRGHRLRVYRPRRDDLPVDDARRDFDEIPLPGIPIRGRGGQFPGRPRCAMMGG